METILTMTITDWLIFVFAIGPYAPLILGLVKQKDESQTFLTWILYLSLDCITMFSSTEVGPHGFAMVFGFAVGSLIMSLILFCQRRFARFSWIEGITITLIIACIFAWQIKGPYWALASGIASESIVGIYLIIRTFKNPVVEYNLSGYIGFLFVSILTIFTAREFGLATVGFAISETALNLIILIPLLKKWNRIRGYYFYE